MTDNTSPEASVATTSQPLRRPVTILLEMRPALDGFAGIPQEVRLLFRGLRTLGSVRVEGMLQTSSRYLSSGLTAKGARKSQAWRLNRFSNVIVSLAETPYQAVYDRVTNYLRRRLSSLWLALGSTLGVTRLRLTRFESALFTDFTWRTLFAKSLPASDFDLVAGANHRVCSVPWNTLHLSGLNSLAWRKRAAYPVLDTRGVDIFIGQTPYPAHVRRGTRMVIRYHDAIPVMMPHTIPDKSKHQATHFRALESNVHDGAWFSCVSEATRQDLLRIFPEAEPRAVTIHNMVSHSYFPVDVDEVAARRVVRSRLYEASGWLPTFLTSREKEGFYARHIEQGLDRYLLMVSTIEPRKNHTRLIAAWEALRATVDPDLKLVIVGTLGWDNKAIELATRGWIERGQIFMLQAVPAPDLRVLYRNAQATICPSLGEGFDFSGVEAMRSGGLCIASDIPVHREVYQDGAVYFDPYATGSLVEAIQDTLYTDDSGPRRERLRSRGIDVSARYTPDHILPQWEAFIARVMAQQ